MAPEVQAIGGVRTVVLALSCCLLSCDDPHQALVRFVHAAPAAPDALLALRLLEDDTADQAEGPLTGSIGYGEATPYVTVASGNLHVEAQWVDPTVPPLLSSELILADDTSYTVVLCGAFGSFDPETALRLRPFEEAFEHTNEQRAVVRFVNAGADAPPLGIDYNHDSDTDVRALPRFADTGPGGVPFFALSPLALGVGNATARGYQEFATFSLPLGPDEALFAIFTGDVSAAPGSEAEFALLPVTRDGARALLGASPPIPR